MKISCKKSKNLRKSRLSDQNYSHRKNSTKDRREKSKITWNKSSIDSSFFQTIVFCSTHFFLYNFSPFFPFLQFPLHWVFQFSNIKTNAIFRKTLISFFVFSVQEDEEKRGGKVFFSYLQIRREIIKMKSFFPLKS